MNQKEIKKIVSEMTLEEKAGMCSGKDNWHLKSVERLGIPEVMVSDGPHGLRKQEDKTDHLGLNGSKRAVCFPAACASACSFDRGLLQELGEAIGEECQAEDVSIVLGPAVNIKRSPLCGRNFEYFSEDPYLASELAKSYISGVQSKQVGTSIKHFAVNNQEFRRMSCSSELDERALREIYLSAFEAAVKEAKPWTVMCSYNRINGVYASENKKLLSDILRDEWGFDGYVMSDWGAVNDRVEGLKAGLDLEMPGCSGVNDKEIIKAVESGRLDESVLDTAVERILSRIFAYWENKTNTVFPYKEHHELAKRIELESAVLLKNEDQLLPLKEGKKIALIGQFAKEPRYQGGGSSHINPYQVKGAWELLNGVSYAMGYTLDDSAAEELAEEAVALAAKSDAAVIFAGLPDAYESEGYDRRHMRLPEQQNHLIERVSRVQPNLVIVLHNGSPVEMPWEKQAKAILEMYLGGEAVGEAAADLLFGKANPSGKLAETFPLRLEDNPSYLNFPGDGNTVRYQEGIFVGYRYYDSKKMAVRYPFGHGLSYTTFEYSGLKLSSDQIKDTDCLTVTFKVKNTGAAAGKEIVQLYVSDHTGSAVRPEKELRHFAKVALSPGEEKTIKMELTKRAFAWYHPERKDWYAASGEYEILIGSSSREIRLSKTVCMENTSGAVQRIEANTVIGDIVANPQAEKVFSKYMDQLWKAFGKPKSDEMTRQIILSLPLRAVRSFCYLPSEELNILLNALNAAVNETARSGR